MTHSDSTTSPIATGAPQPRSVAAIVVAAGRGQRFGAAENKVLLPLAGTPIWVHSVLALQASPAVGQVVLVVRPCDRSRLEAEASRLGVAMVDGGAERYDSVKAGLDWLVQNERLTPWVAVHDAARPLVSRQDLDAVFATAVAHHAAILATPVRGTLKRGRADASAIATVDRTDLWEALTPQVFAASVLQSAYTRHRGRPVTDDAELVERTGVSVCLVPGSAENLKITCAEDLQIAEAILSRRNAS